MNILFSLLMHAYRDRELQKSSMYIRWEKKETICLHTIAFFLFIELAFMILLS